jgi:hypothetical protein
MGQFTDSILLKLSDPQQLAAVLTTPGATTGAGLQVLFNAAFTLPYATVSSLNSLAVLSVEIERPVLVERRRRGYWTQAQPHYARTEVTYDDVDPLAPLWIDLAAQVKINATLNVDPGVLESTLINDLPAQATLADYQAQLPFFDFATFMAEHGISTVDQLRESTSFLVGQLKYKAATPFNPNDPANTYTLPLSVPILVRETVDLSASLRDAKLARIVMERGLGYVRDPVAGIGPADVKSPFVPAAILPQPAAGSAIATSSAQALFAQEGVLLSFQNPS